MPGRLVYFEIASGDEERAKQFWHSLFGWKFSDMEGAPLPYSTFEPEGPPTGGMYQTESADRGVSVYFDVDDIEDASDRVRALGGEVLQDKTAVPSMGWWAACKDPEGNEFSLWQTDESAA
jgi:predicted enzyme related to lactoylglutathione lyase